MALTKFNFNSFDLTTAASKGIAFNSSANGLETAAEGSMTLIKTLTASSDSTISFVHGSSSVVLDNTYPIYVFKYINMHPATNGDNIHFTVNFRDGSTAYDATKTTTFFADYNNENNSGAGIGYETAHHLAQSTSALNIAKQTGGGSDESNSGEMTLFNPASTTFVKHFIARTNVYLAHDVSQTQYVAGYCNVTDAIDGVQFAFSSGNIETGTIKLYGIKDS